MEESAVKATQAIGTCGGDRRPPLPFFHPWYYVYAHLLSCSHRLAASIRRSFPPEDVAPGKARRYTTPSHAATPHRCQALPHSTFVLSADVCLVVYNTHALPSAGVVAFGQSLFCGGIANFDGVNGSTTGLDQVADVLLNSSITPER